MNMLKHGRTRLVFQNYQTWVVYIILITLSCLMHFLVLKEFSSRAEFILPVMDEATYHLQALQWLNEDFRMTEPYWQPPGYFLWLGIIYFFNGVDFVHARYVQMFFLAGIALLTYHFGRRLNSARVGFMAGLLVILNGPVLLYNTRLLPSVPGTFFMLTSVMCYIRAGETKKNRDYFLTGLMIGWSSFFIANILALLPGCLFYQAKYRSSKWKKNSFVFLLGAILALMPITIQNYKISGKFVPISTNGGINLYIGNHIDRLHMTTIRPGIEWERLTTRPYHEGAKSAVEAEKVFYSKVRQFIIEHPVLFLKGLGLKFIEFFSPREIPRNIDPYVFSDRSFILSVLCWKWGMFGFPFGVIGPMAIAALSTRWREPKYQLFLVLIVCFMISSVLFFPGSRYRLPVIPLMCLFAAISSSDLIHADAWKRFLSLSKILILISLLCLFNRHTDKSYFHFNYYAELLNAAGSFLEYWGKRDQAIDFYHASIRESDQYDDAFFNLAKALKIKGDIKNAAQYFRKVIELNSDHDQALCHLGEIEIRQQNRLQALILFDKALKINPYNIMALLNKGNLMFEMNALDEALKMYSKVLLLQPDQTHAQYMKLQCYELRDV